MLSLTGNVTNTIYNEQQNFIQKCDQGDAKRYAQQIGINKEAVPFQKFAHINQ